MKIINNESGKAYQIYPDTELEIERTNPFFNDYGEQSLPVNLPYSDYNKQIIGRPHFLGNKSKVRKNIDVTIQDGEFVVSARQAILSAQKNSDLPTSFYLNEGAFYAYLTNTKLKDIFGTEMIAGVNTLDQAINFCYQLMFLEDERFAIFPVYVTLNEQRKLLNRLAWLNQDGSVNTALRIVSDSTTSPSLYNAYERIETIEIDGNEIDLTVPRGFHITPFMKVNYLLKRIFENYGYTIQDSMFTQVQPFTRMVLVNNVADAIINGDIKYGDLVPDITVQEFLNIIRSKFNCEFIPDESAKTVTVRFFKDINVSKADTDLTPYLTSQPEVDFTEPFKQLNIKSEETTSETSNAFESLADLYRKYPTAVLNKADMSFYRTGFSLGVKNVERISDASIPYIDTLTDKNEVKEITIQDRQMVMVESSIIADTIPSGTRSTVLYMPILHAGQGVYLYSTLLYDATGSNEFAETKTETSEDPLSVMFAFYYDCTGHNYMHGTISSYNYLGNTRLWDYSLCYFGPDGLFERFYRPLDTLYRNSLLPVRAELKLTGLLKHQIKSWAKILLQGHELLINVLKYKIGGFDQPQEAEFFTTQLYEPVAIAEYESNKITAPTLQWTAENSKQEITLAEYEASPYKDAKPPIFYPGHPSFLNQVAYPQYTARNDGGVYNLYTYTLKAILI